MKLLFATSLLPENDATSGYEIANRAIFHGFQALGHDVTAVGFINPGKETTVAKGSVNLGALAISNADVNSLQKLVWLQRAIKNNTTFSGAKLQITTQEAFASIIGQAGPFDAVIVNGASIAAAFEKILTQTPFAFIAHNVEWKTAAQNAKTVSGFFERILFAREARLLKALEKRMTEKANHIFTFADDDSAEFRLMGARSVSSVPLIVSLEAEKPVDRMPKWDAGLIGTWSWAPNRVGLDWFLNEVAPHLPDDFTFAIAGKLPGPPQMKHPGATVLGRVASALDFTRDCACMPLVSRAGTGVQLKTLEVFELGLPTVATTSSVRGIAHVPDNCMITDDPKQFAQALVLAARNGQSSDLDGRKFQESQKAQMIAALGAGLTRLQPQPFAQAAE